MACYLSFLNSSNNVRMMAFRFGLRFAFPKLNRPRGKALNIALRFVERLLNGADPNQTTTTPLPETSTQDTSTIRLKRLFVVSATVIIS